MNLVIDGYNLLHANRLLSGVSATKLRRERDRLIDRLSAYRKEKGWAVTLVFDGWQEGWFAEQKEYVKGVEVIYSQRGERADDVIKRIARSKGGAVVIVSSDRELEKYAARMAIAVVPSEQFHERLERIACPDGGFADSVGEDETRLKRKGPSKMLSKREKRLRSALKKL